MEKTFMTNREFKRTRKYFKKQFQDEKLTLDMLDIEEFKLFEAEENKRLVAKAYTKNWKTTRKLDPKIRVRAFKYLQKYKKLDKERDELIKKLYLKPDIDMIIIRKYVRKLNSFRHFEDVKKELISAYCFDGKVFYRGIRPSIEKPESEEKEFKKVYKDAVLKLKRETSLFATILKQTKKDIKNIKQEQAEFIKNIVKQKEIKAAKDKIKHTAIEKEFAFKNR